MNKLLTSQKKIMVKNKMTTSDNSAVDFIESIQNETRKKDGLFLMDMMKRITQVEPTKWGPSIIGCDSYVHVYESGHEKRLPLLAFSPRKQYLVLYVLNNFENQQHLLDNLGKYKRGNICLYINKLADVDVEILEKIVLSSYNKDKLKWLK